MTGFLIAGTSSTVGKTTAFLAIVAALRRRGHTVQPFKAGPDFLDTGHHSRIAGRASHNLDTWMLSHKANTEIFLRAVQDADVVMAEGMMGLFDGKSGLDEQGSSAEVAKLLRLPVVLVVDAEKSARSVAAMLLGFELFDPELKLAGVILNRVAGERHFQMLQAAITKRCGTPVLGWLPHEPAISMRERYLGLQTAEEFRNGDLEKRLDVLARIAERYLDVDSLLRLQFDLGDSASFKTCAYAERLVRIGVAYDPAFSFYYQDNLELLREQGAEIVFFSPLVDRCLPPELDALYLGGGYPELYAGKLSSNSGMMKAVADFARSLRPIFAECGGMIYLTKSLKAKDGQTYKMAGVLDAHVEMTSVLQRFGYVTVELTDDCILGVKGMVIRGHSFHYSHMTETGVLPTSYKVHYSLSDKVEEEGFQTEERNVLASYLHLHFRSNPLSAEHFIKAALMSRVACLTG